MFCTCVSRSLPHADISFASRMRISSVTWPISRQACNTKHVHVHTILTASCTAVSTWHNWSNDRFLYPLYNAAYCRQESIIAKSYDVSNLNTWNPRVSSRVTDKVSCYIHIKHGSTHPWNNRPSPTGFGLYCRVSHYVQTRDPLATTTLWQGNLLWTDFVAWGSFVCTPNILNP